MAFVATVRAELGVGGLAAEDGVGVSRAAEEALAVVRVGAALIVIAARLADVRDGPARDVSRGSALAVGAIEAQRAILITATRLHADVLVADAHAEAAAALVAFRARLAEAVVLCRADSG